jgi:hypothetical protein
MPKTAKIGRVNQAMSDELSFEDGATVADALSAAEITTVKGETISINGRVVSDTYVFADNAKIYVLPSTTGGI